MDPAATCVSNWWLRAVLGVALIAAPACSGSRSASDTRQAADQSASASGGNGAATTSGANPGIDLNCLFDRVQNPPEAFHYSFTHDSGSAFVAEDADLTPQQIDGTLKDRSGAVTKTFHGVRSDPAGWQAAWSNLTAVSSASSTFALVRGTDATVRQGEEQVNGYDTVKYSIDTTRSSGAEAALYQTTLGSGGFEKGTVWVTSNGCPVKISLDTEMQLNGGGVQKDHFEEAMTKK